MYDILISFLSIYYSSFVLRSKIVMDNTRLILVLAMFRHINLDGFIILVGQHLRAKHTLWLGSVSALGAYYEVGKVNRPTIFFLSGFYCSRGEDLVHQKRKYFHET